MIRHTNRQTEITNLIMHTYMVSQKYIVGVMGAEG